MRDIPGDVGLILQLPVTRLPEHVGNLRNTLLARTGLSASEEAATILSIKDMISQRLPGMFDVNMDSDISPAPLQKNLTWAVKAEIGQWLRRGVAEHIRDAPE